jgi:hypothetical protein
MRRRVREAVAREIEDSKKAILRARGEQVPGSVTDVLLAGVYESLTRIRILAVDGKPAR